MKLFKTYRSYTCSLALKPVYIPALRNAVCVNRVKVFCDAYHMFGKIHTKFLALLSMGSHIVCRYVNEV